jgi:hypothetical protein
MFITVELKETYLDKQADSLTVEVFKNWTNAGQNYVRMLSSIPGVPRYQAVAMKKAVNCLATEAKVRVIPKDNILYLKR